MNEVAEVAIVGFHIGLAGSHMLAPKPKFAHFEGDPALFSIFVRRAWILWQIQAHHADSAGELHCPHETVEHHRVILMALRVMSLVTDAVATAVGASTFGLFKDLLDGRSLGIVDRGDADLFGQLEPVGMTVDDHYVGSAFDHR